MHGPEAGCGQGDEHLRVLGDGGGHVVVSAVQAGVHELPGVAGIQIRAGRARDRAAVVAAGQYLMPRPNVSVPIRWIGLAQNPTFSAFRHQDSKPGEAARRTICTTTIGGIDASRNTRQDRNLAAAAAAAAGVSRGERHWWALPLPDVPAEGWWGANWVAR